MAKIGIDFGTTNSLMVSYDKKDGFRYFDVFGGKPSPTSSTVWYHDNTVTVGKEARKQIASLSGEEGHHFEKSIKSKLGSEKNIYVFGKALSPSDVAYEIINNLKVKAIDAHAEESGVDLKKAVFTIPINFNGKQRQDLRKSAREAGIEVSSFVHEPFAAIVGYYYTREQTKHTDVVKLLKSMEGQYLLVFDWGGGTLDITVVKIIDGKMVELGTSELTGMAGDKFDEDVAKLVWNRYVKECDYKYSNEYLESLRKANWGRIISLAEECKIDLSEEDEYDFLYSLTEDEEIDTEITREDFEEVISDTLKAAIHQIDKALDMAGVSKNDIRHVLLTGGTCYIPAVQNEMKKHFGARVETIKDADLLIGQGAAVISEMGWLPFLTKDIMLQLSDNSYWPIFEKGTPIAANKAANFVEELLCTDSSTKRAKIIVCEGTNQQSDQTLAVLNVPLQGNITYGDNVLLEASIDENIILKISGSSTLNTGIDDDGYYSRRVSKEVYKLCFGLSIAGDQHE